MDDIQGLRVLHQPQNFNAAQGSRPFHSFHYHNVVVDPDYKLATSYFTESRIEQITIKLDCPQGGCRQQLQPSLHFTWCRSSSFLPPLSIQTRRRSGTLQERLLHFRRVCLGRSGQPIYSLEARYGGVANERGSLAACKRWEKAVGAWDRLDRRQRPVNAGSHLVAPLDPVSLPVVTTRSCPAVVRLPCLVSTWRQKTGWVALRLAFRQ